MPTLPMYKLGRYEILAELGRGAMGTVYRARDPQIDRIVAIKTISALAANPSEKEEYRKRFFREAQAAGKLSHPGIVTIYDVGEEEATQTPYIVMEHIAGETLANLLTGEAREGRSLETSLGLAKQLAEALDYAHAQKIVHRDIKPSNIIVTPEGRAKITDFGVAKLTQTEFTVPGQLLGTPSYVSPEQLKGEPVDGRSDLFSLGVILYWMLAGDKPFTGDAAAVFCKILYQNPVQVTHYNPALRPEFDAVVNRALAKEPSARYQRGKDLADDLQDLLKGRVPRSQPAMPYEGSTERTVLQSEVGSLLVEKADLLKSGSPSPAPARQTSLSMPYGRVGTSARLSRPKVGTGYRRFAKRLSIAGAITVAGAIVLFLLFRPSSGPIKTASQPQQLKQLFRRESRPPSGPIRTASLQINCYHSFRTAEISVWIDDDLAYEGKMVGASERRFQLFKPKLASTNFNKIVQVPAGEHEVRVRVRSPDEGYERTKETEADFPEDGEKTLAISFGGRNKDLHLSWQ